MSKLVGTLAAVFVPAFFAAGVIATPAMAQEKATIKELTSSDKARAYEITYKPGQSSDLTAGERIVRALEGGTLERTEADGKKVKSEWQADQVRISKTAQGYSARNTGTTDVRLYIVELK